MPPIPLLSKCYKTTHLSRNFGARAVEIKSKFVVLLESFNPARFPKKWKMENGKWKMKVFLDFPFSIFRFPFLCVDLSYADIGKSFYVRRK